MLIRVRETEFPLPDDPPRTGHHLSSIIKDLLITVDPKTYSPRPIDRAAHGTFQRGYAWEDYLRARGHWGSRVQYQCEFIKDDITCTLDGFSLTCDDPLIVVPPSFRRHPVVWESKGTFYSINNPIQGPKFVGWKWQIMGYCSASSSRRSVLDVLWLNGDYRPMRTVPKRYFWWFKPRALDANWLMLTRHRDRMVREGRLPKL